MYFDFTANLGSRVNYANVKQFETEGLINYRT